MGIKLLNTFLRSKFPKTINTVKWEKIANKKVVVDTNNYMYKFLSEDRLIDGFISMCSLFNHYSITPLFIFDGKAPVEKMEEIIERRETRKKYKEIFKSIFEVMKGKTVIISIHKDVIDDLADEIYNIDDGKFKKVK